LGLKLEQTPLGDHRIGQTTQGEQLRRVLGQAPAPYLLQTEQVLEDAERMFDLGPDACLDLLHLLVQSPHFGVRQDLAFAIAHRHMPSRVGGLVFGPLLGTLVTGIAKRQALLAMQQGMGLGDIADVGRCRDHPQDPLQANRRSFASLALGVRTVPVPPPARTMA